MAVKSVLPIRTIDYAESNYNARRRVLLSKAEKGLDKWRYASEGQIIQIQTSGNG